MNMTDNMYRTPEGFELHKPLLMPEVRSFGEVLTFVRPWDHATMNHTNGVPGPEYIEDLEFDGNRITPFCSVRMGPGVRYSMAVRPTDALLAALEGQLLGIDDSLSFEIILHQDRNRCLVIISHNQIIGSRYVAYIDPATVPGDGLRIVPSEQAGYVPGSWVVQKFDPAVGVWFDVGDPKSREEAERVVRERETN